MPATRHVRCRVCGVRTVHASARFEMCPKHERQYNQRRNEERRKTKARVRARAALAATVAVQREPEPDAVGEPVSEPVLTEPGVVVEVVRPKTHAEYTRDAIARLPESILLEIGSFYEDRRIKSSDITTEFGISNGMLTAIVDSLGLERRKTGYNQGLRPGFFERTGDGKRVWIDEAEATRSEPEPQAVPEPQRKALEQMLKLPATPEPVAAPARTSQPAPLRNIEGRYEITVVGTLSVSAMSMLEAMQYMVEQHPELHVQQIREMWPGHTS